MNRLAMSAAARDLMIRNIDEIMQAVSRYGDDVPGVGRIREDLAKIKVIPEEATSLDEETWIREAAEEIVPEDAHISELSACMNILRELVPLLRRT